MANIVDVGTRYAIEVREPNIGEWIMLPGPLFIYVTNRHDQLRKQACVVIIGTLTRIEYMGHIRFLVDELPLDGPAPMSRAQMHKLWFHQ